MAHDSDAEGQTANEETPLLGDRQSGQQPESNEPDQQQAGGWLWGIFWAVVAALVLAVFIKGWIDAGGDVDVGGVA